VERDPKAELKADFTSTFAGPPGNEDDPPPSDPSEGKLEIVKLEYGTTNRLDGAEFEVTRTSRWERRLVDPNGDDTGEFYDDDNGDVLDSGDPGYHHNVEDLADDVWEWIEVHEIEYVGTYSTVNGAVSLDVAPGSFEVRELTPPSGFVLDENNVKKVDVPLEGGAVTLTFENKLLPTLTVRKYDELTNAPLAGASFRLWRTDGETWSETKATGADGSITWTDLEPGVYSVLETDEPYGYFKDPARKEVLLEAGDNKQLEFFNRPRPTLVIHKRDYVTDETLANFKFRVQKLEGETIGEFLTDENGRIELSPATGYLLTEDIYRITEVTPGENYLLSADSVRDVTLKWQEPTEVVFKNVLKPTLIFQKRNGLTGRGISDATYKVEYEDANGGIASLGTYKTKCGLIVLPHVQPGWYILTETAPAPGYSLPSNPVQRLHLAPGENSYTYSQTTTELYVDPRTNPASGERGACGDWCGHLCSILCAGNCGNPGGGDLSSNNGNGAFGNMVITNGNGNPIGTVTSTTPTTPVTPVTPPPTTPATPPANSGDFSNLVITNGNGDPLGTPATPEPTPDPAQDTPLSNGGVMYLNPAFPGISVTFGNQ
jgi:hypothetical protein